MRARAAADAEYHSLPIEENMRRLALLARMENEGKTLALLEELYRDDHIGLESHYRCEEWKAAHGEAARSPDRGGMVPTRPHRSGTGRGNPEKWARQGMQWRMSCILKGHDPTSSGEDPPKRTESWEKRRRQGGETLPRHQAFRKALLTASDESAILSECEEHVRLHGGTLTILA